MLSMITGNRFGLFQVGGKSQDLTAPTAGLYISASDAAAVKISFL